MANMEDELQRLQLRLELEDFEDLAMVPWFSYRMRLPKRPLPRLSDRPRITTERLIVRPILPSDLDGLHTLRQRPETQNHSRTRGRPDQNIEETQQSIEMLNQDYQHHWYFGGFLQSTGELIAEGGLPDCAIMASSASGWPEAEFLVKPEYWRQGYGTEFFNAVMESWWDLPREWRRVQVFPAGMPGKEPGDVAMEGVVFQWEEGNEVAERFFNKVLEEKTCIASGSAVTTLKDWGEEYFGASKQTWGMRSMDSDAGLVLDI
ncbi:hypothetical protein VMCG_05567 [Cytospora schulzeri]|uniref:N-acetyltransferase domain-containing protein n=1 Tax=Cytospora schulzeri TaxID=448051 RepID=A0A423WEJ4_9PEZI|nr:hypothetical protein VMCG_05567 [Valsa malicola]